MTILEVILTISALCLGLRTITDDNKLFYFVRLFAIHKLPEFIGKPLIVCCACMASFWGVVINFALFVHFNGLVIPSWPQVLVMLFTCIVASFVNDFMWNLLLYFKRQKIVFQN
jgi:hypothetical protein